MTRIWSALQQPNPILQIVVCQMKESVELKDRKQHDNATQCKPSRSKFRQLQPNDLIQTYFNCCWTLLFVPFYIVQSGRSYKFRYSRIQKSICMMLHSITIVNAMLEIHGSYEAPIKYDATVAFLVAERVAAAAIPIIFFHMVWFKQDEILEFLQVLHNSMPMTASRKLSRKPVVALFLVRLSLSSIYVLKRYFHVSMSQYSLISNPHVLQFMASQALFKLHQKDALYENMDVPFQNLSAVVKGVAYTNIVLSAYYSLLLDTVALLALFASIIAYTITSEFIDTLKASPHGIGDDIKQPWIPRKLLVTQRYYEMKHKLACLNKIVGSIYLAVFCSLVAFLSGIGILTLMIEGNYFEVCLVSVYIATYVITLVLAAEANHKANAFKEWLLFQGRADNVQDIYEYLRISGDQLGLQGGKFFVVSYGFLGTSLSVLLTYSIIMIDFARVTVLPDQHTSMKLPTHSD